MKPNNLFAHAQKTWIFIVLIGLTLSTFGVQSPAQAQKLACTATTCPDLAIYSIIVVPPDKNLDPNVYTNDDFSIGITYHNNNIVAADSPFTINICLRTASGATATCTNLERNYHIIPSGLPANGNKTSTIMIRAGKLPANNYKVTVHIDSANVIAEFNESNNIVAKSFTVKALSSAVPPATPPANDNFGNAALVTLTN